MAKPIIIISIIILCYFGLWFLSVQESNNISEREIIENREEVDDPDMDLIKKAFLLKYPGWEMDNFRIAFETKFPNHAMGTIFFNKNNAESNWYAARVGGQWMITDYGGTGYFGDCNNFEKYRFPQGLIPDCWNDEEKILVNTSNPERFYGGLKLEDKDKLVNSFLDFRENNDFYSGKNLYVKFNEIMGNYLKGVILIGGVENISTPHFLAAKKDNNWKVLYYGQEDPFCDDIEGYDFPLEMVSGCWKSGDNWVKR